MIVFRMFFKKTQDYDCDVKTGFYPFSHFTLLPHIIDSPPALHLFLAGQINTEQYYILYPALSQDMHSIYN